MLRQAKKERPDLILYPVPPWYIMAMGPFIRKVTKIPYAIDFMDPWVHEIQNKDVKSRLSQWIARRLEGRILRGSSAIFAVSEGILSELRSRYPWVASKPMIVVPYGVEISDFQTIYSNKEIKNHVVIRYMGAVSEKMLPVIDAILKTLKKVNSVVPIKVIFTGTSYAGPGLIKPVLSDLINRNGVGDLVVEHAQRVGYKEALELGKSCDLQLLIGNTTTYYAASKMIGMVASGTPFFAFVHTNSFPASFLNDLNYEFKVSFTPSELNSPAKLDELYSGILKAIKNRGRYVPVDINHPVLSKYTAKAMTKTFADTFQKIIHER
jgi:hypothetical protein